VAGALSRQSQPKVLLGTSEPFRIIRNSWKARLLFLLAAVVGFPYLGFSFHPVPRDRGSFGKNAKHVKKNLAFVQNYFNRLELAIAAKGASKGSLAAHLGVALSTLSRWRNAVPRAETVHATADFLGVSAKWLLCGEDAPTFVSVVNEMESGYPAPALSIEERIMRMENLLAEMASKHDDLAELIRSTLTNPKP